MGLYVFDAYGTLFDVHAAAEREKDAIGPTWQELSRTWRTKHIEYSWHHAFTGKPATFWQLARAQPRLCHRGDGRRRERRGARAPARLLPHHGRLPGSARGAGRVEGARR